MKKHELLPLALLLVGCAHQEPTPPVRTLSVDEVAALVPPKVKDREGWADDVITAIRLTHKEPTPERVCAVLAVIEQESGFQTDPVVPNLPKIVREGLDDKLEPLGPLKGAVIGTINEKYGKRIDALKTERDLDRLFREISMEMGDQLGPVAMLGRGTIESFNPVTTAGSMQVKVDFAKEFIDDDEEVRELLYTRAGGVRFGTARLIGYEASYDDITYRFADYNAGMYASRNAMFQQMLSDLTGHKLVTDGDLLAYDENGEPKDVETNSLRAMKAFAPDHNVLRDAKKEKSVDFEKTKLWKMVRDEWSHVKGKPAPYAKVPNVDLSSPKLSKPRTTSWFATSVKRRYDACRTKAD
jgi:hypothetical protein